MASALGATRTQDRGHVVSSAASSFRIRLPFRLRAAKVSRRARGERMGDMGDIPRRRMRSASVAIGVTAVAAAALSGCSSSPDYNAVCMDDKTQQRVSDDQCDDSGTYGSSYRWYYLARGAVRPSIGSRVSGGSTVEPAGSVARGGQSSCGDSGSSSHGSSSHDYGGFGGHSGGVSS